MYIKQPCTSSYGLPPIVDLCSDINLPSVTRATNDVLPTPTSPTTITFLLYSIEQAVEEEEPRPAEANEWAWFTGLGLIIILGCYVRVSVQSAIDRRPFSGKDYVCCKLCIKQMGT